LDLMTVIRLVRPQPGHLSLFSTPFFQKCFSSRNTMLSLTLKVFWLTFSILGPSPPISIALTLTLPSQVSQRHGSSSSHLPPPLGPTGPRSSTASQSPSLRSSSPSVRPSLPFLSHPDPPSARHDMEDESFQNAALVLYRTNRNHRSMLPRSHWHMRMFYLGLVSNRLQAVSFDTSVGVVRVFLAESVDSEG
jgi:hypothetical protein